MHNLGDAGGHQRVYTDLVGPRRGQQDWHIRHAFVQRGSQIKGRSGRRDMPHQQRVEPLRYRSARRQRIPCARVNPIGSYPSAASISSSASNRSFCIHHQHCLAAAATTRKRRFLSLHSASPTSPAYPSRQHGARRIVPGPRGLDQFREPEWATKAKLPSCGRACAMAARASPS